MLKFFIDFDGTITRQDVGDALFERFGGERSVQAVDQYIEGKLSAADCFRIECDACGTVDTNALKNFLSRQAVDSTFREFAAFCKSNNFPFYILSDGMDYYIKTILDQNGLSDVLFFSNVLHLEPEAGTGGVRFIPEFPYRDEVCDRCACCKRNHILTLCADDDIIVYIGEGYSDRCPAKFADVVFAKDDLLRHCQQENISYFEYCTFADIVDRMSILLSDTSKSNKHVLRKRRQAVQARADVLLGG
jgi:2,3-diketo-5-methylthio-1-phosphopentane phosphatase